MREENSSLFADFLAPTINVKRRDPSARKRAHSSAETATAFEEERAPV